MPAIIRCKIFCLPIWYPKYKTKLYRTIILPAVLYGCETWSLTLREERRLRVSENRVLGRIFEPKRHEVTGEWRRVRNEELCDMRSPNITRVIKSRRMKWTGHAAGMVERTGVHRGLVGKSEGKRPLGRHRRRWEVILKWIFKKWDGRHGLDWSGSE